MPGRAVLLSLLPIARSPDPPARKTFLVNADLSAAPEIAQLAVRVDVSAAAAAPAALGTLGSLAAELASLAAQPQRWWELVRFDPARPLRIDVTPAAWLLVIPPAGAVAGCRCGLATLIAGEAREAAAGRQIPLRPGRTVVHGRAENHLVLGSAHSYSVSLHLSSPERELISPP